MSHLRTPTPAPLPRTLYPDPITIHPSDLLRYDPSPDTLFYQTPRFVHHIDDGAIAALQAYYSTVISRNTRVLDLCSSWTSHLPVSLKPDVLVGIGMNAAELRANTHLTSWLEKDLNVLPVELAELQDGSVDVVICSVSVDYLAYPVEVFRELGRVVRAKGTAHMAFSNRCFPTKVVAAWMRMSDVERRRWVGMYFWASGGWEEVEEVVLKDGGQGDPLFVVRARKTDT